MGEWGTFCDDFFDEDAATVACRQMGYSSGVQTESGIFDNEYGGYATIFLDNVLCDGREAHIMECSHNPWLDHNCGSEETVNIWCEGHLTTGGSLDVPDGATRIMGGANPDEGLLEVFNHGTWGTVCDDFFNEFAAQAACSAMGYDIGHVKEDSDNHIQGRQEQPIWIDNMYCGEGAASLNECMQNRIGDDYCGHHEDVNIVCGYHDHDDDDDEVGPEDDDDNDKVADGELLLLVTDSPHEGLLKIAYNGDWGFVCDDMFDDDAAAVACRELGYSGGELTDGIGHDISPVKFFLDDVFCMGSEARIIECSHRPWLENNCISHETVNIRCDGPGYEDYSSSGYGDYSGSGNYNDGAPDSMDDEDYSYYYRK